MSLRMIEEHYLDIVASVDEEFARNRRLYGEKIRCRAGCTECCYQLFQITEIEAAHISEGIQKFLFPADLGVGRFTKIGLPSPEVLASFVGIVEIVGGLLLLLENVR